MTGQEIAAHDVITFGDLEILASASCSCITIVSHIATPFELSVRLKKAMRSVEKILGEKRRSEAAKVKSLLEPIRKLATTVDTVGIWSNALILFRSPDVFRYFLLYARPPEVVSVETRFQVRPLLSALAREPRFHLLCLSRKHIRLLHCTQHRAEEGRLRGTIPQDMGIWMNNRMPDHVLDNRATAGPSVGSMKGVAFGTSTDHEREDEYLAHFFKAVDKGVNLLLRGDTAPLLLAGVEEEVAAYRRVSAYPRLLDKAVQGSPDGLPDRELHKRAMHVVMQSHSESLEKSLADFEKHRDKGRISSDGHEIVRAAFEGRVADLFFSEDAEIRGAWNPETQEIEPGEHDEDLLNAAALQTVLHGGRAFALEDSDMPVEREVAAVLRF